MKLVQGFLRVSQGFLELLFLVRRFAHKVEIKKLQQQLDKYIEKYGELEPEKPKLQYQAEIQQEKSKKIIYKSKSKSQGYDITD